MQEAQKISGISRTGQSSAEENKAVVNPQQVHSDVQKAPIGNGLDAAAGLETGADKVLPDKAGRLEDLDIGKLLSVQQTDKILEKYQYFVKNTPEVETEDGFMMRVVRRL